MVIDEDPKILALISSYDNEGTLLTLRNDLIQLLRSKRSYNSSPDGDVSSSSTSSADRRRRLSSFLTVSIPPKSIQKIEGRDI